MAKRDLLVTFGSHLETPSGIPRIRNWAEDLFRTVSRKGWGTGLAVLRSLEGSHLLDDAEVTRLSGAEDRSGKGSGLTGE